MIFLGKKKYFFHKIMAAFLSCVFLFSLTACSEEKVMETVTAYGTYGEKIALDLARNYPFRSAFSEQEKGAGAYIKKAFEELGFTVQEQVFSSPDQTGSSKNYIVRIDGDGFMAPDEKGKYQKKERTVVVGCHYDSFFSEADKETVTGYLGVHDNAAGVGALLTLAKSLQDVKVGYDVVLVAFGAGAVEPLGSQYFFNSLSAEEKAAVEVMYCIDSIYAGDKLYASSGLTSILPGMKYEMRRKMYELYDVVYEFEISSEKVGGFDILYNQSSLLVDLNGDEHPDVFREVSLSQSDYVPFDKAGIPVVFIESFDYNYAEIEKMKETRNLNLQEYGGFVRNTELDSVTILRAVLPEGRLERRINTVAFALNKAILKGAHDAVTTTEYANGQRLEPTVSVTSVTSVGTKESTLA